MSARESVVRETLTQYGRSLFERGLTPGTSGNLSARCDRGTLVTPTNSCLGDLDPSNIALIDNNGQHISGDAPSKEAFLHSRMYRSRKSAAAVVHLHCTHAVAVSCLKDLDPRAPIPALTPYFVMKVGDLRLLPYFPPGDTELAHAVEAVAAKHHSILLANHGPVVAGSSVQAAVAAIEELEEAAKLSLLLRGMRTKPLSAQQIADLTHRFRS